MFSNGILFLLILLLMIWRRRIGSRWYFLKFIILGAANGHLFQVDTVGLGYFGRQDVIFRDYDLLLWKLCLDNGRGLFAGESAMPRVLLQLSCLRYWATREEEVLVIGQLDLLLLLWFLLLFAALILFLLWLGYDHGLLLDNNISTTFMNLFRLFQRLLPVKNHDLLCLSIILLLLLQNL